GEVAGHEGLQLAVGGQRARVQGDAHARGLGSVVGEGDQDDQPARLAVAVGGSGGDAGLVHDAAADEDVEGALVHQSWSSSTISPESRSTTTRSPPMTLSATLRPSRPLIKRGAGT